MKFCSGDEKMTNASGQGPVARSLVNANRWLRGIKMYRFPWYLTLVSTNHVSSNPGLLGKNERQWKKSEQEHVRYFLHKTCNQETSGSFTL